MFLDNLASTFLFLCGAMNLSYEQASERRDLSSRYFGDIACGKTAPTVLTLEKLCNGLETTPNELLLPAEAFHQLSFRQPMAVLQVRCFQQQGRAVVYPVCPRCGITMEREYQHFCDRCGQQLDWSAFSLNSSQD